MPDPTDAGDLSSEGWRPRLVWALDSEINTATDLLGAGVSMMLDGVWGEHKSAPAFTCLASGVERVLKLHLGLTATSSGNDWPPKEFRRKYLHHLDHLWSDVRLHLAASVSGAPSTYVAGLLAEVDADPYWPRIMRSLNAWADSSGRYRDFEILGGGLPLMPSAPDIWRETSTQVMEDLGLLGEIGGPNFQDALVMINERLCLSILTWWHTMYRTWQHGFAGPRAKRFSHLLSPNDQRLLGATARNMLRGR